MSAESPVWLDSILKSNPLADFLDLTIVAGDILLRQRQFDAMNVRSSQKERIRTNLLASFSLLAESHFVPSTVGLSTTWKFAIPNGTSVNRWVLTTTDWNSSVNLTLSSSDIANGQSPRTTKMMFNANGLLDYTPPDGREELSPDQVHDMSVSLTEDFLKDLAS